MKIKQRVDITRLKSLYTLTSNFPLKKDNPKHQQLISAREYWRKEINAYHYKMDKIKEICKIELDENNKIISGNKDSYILAFKLLLSKFYIVEATMDSQTLLDLFPDDALESKIHLAIKYLQK